jgi:cytochrome c
MKMNFGKLKSGSAIAALSIILAACGGGEPAAKTPAKAPAAEVETPDTTEVETAASEVEEVVEEVATETAEVVEEAAEAVEEAAEEVTEAATSAGADDRVTAETIAAYEALTGDAAKGKRVFTQCMSCHSVQEGKNLSGPSLYGIVGRTSGTIEGFKYSPANADSGIVWTEATMFAYLENPRAFIPGTLMSFPGLRKEQDRADVIAYLKSVPK